MPVIRAFRKGDLDALYAISLATGFEGGDASHLYADPKLMGHIYAAPYALLAPELAIVVEDGEGIAGFALGTADTVAWERRLEESWWPALRERHAMPSEADRTQWTADQRRAFTIHRPSHTPDRITLPYPAHLHMNLLPRAQGRGIGSALFERWTEIAGAPRLHVAVNHANAGGLAFWRRLGFSDLAAEGRTVWLGRDLEA
ncbi:MAG TPA: GNAT family N-acetyltransferase [Reyranella sp.]|nr:GNAT family N-acetyltransferase [Reyranella sp.]